MKAFDICVYGDFSKKDMRLKVFTDQNPSMYQFQNILREAGYDAELFLIDDTRYPELFETK